MKKMNGIDVHAFVKDLKKGKIFTAKQCLVIENLYIYFKDLKVYKVIIAVNPSMLKKAKKLGLNSQYTTIYIDDVKISIPNMDVSKGSYIGLYNVNDGRCNVFHGEETEEEQRKRLLSTRMARKNKSE